MAITLTCVSLILFLCIIADKFSGKFGMPTLILFMGIGMIFGSDGIFKIAFSNYEFAGKNLHHCPMFHYVLWWFQYKIGYR